jgi:hypothetical protein
MSTWLHDSRLVCYNSVISVSSTCAAPAASCMVLQLELLMMDINSCINQ